jgi:hypothetical protein
MCEYVYSFQTAQNGHERMWQWIFRFQNAKAVIWSAERLSESKKKKYIPRGVPNLYETDDACRL